MNSRERTIAAINHRQPDRPPLYVSLTPQIADKKGAGKTALVGTVTIGAS